ncbi:hypothetical protein [Nakamurella multipartita]|nr:hypothetical protein [Nakamurella multipartita]
MTNVLIEPSTTVAVDDPGGFDFPDLAADPPDDPTSTTRHPRGDNRDDEGSDPPRGGDDEERQDRRPSRHRQRAERVLIRRAVHRSRALAAADPDDLRLLAAVLGSGVDLATLTVAALTAPRTATAALDDVLALRGMDRADQMAEVAFMERRRTLSLWTILSELGAVDGRRPTVDIVATKATVAAVAALSDATVARVERVVDLARGA